MGNIGAPELIVIALIALLLFGAGRIADIGKGLGQGIKNFKQGLKEAGDDDDMKVEDDGAAGKKPGAGKKPAAVAKKKAEEEEAAEEA